MDHSLCAQWPRLRCHCRITTRHHGLEQLERSRSAALAKDVSTTTGIRAAASGRPLVAFLSSLGGLVRNISRSPALKCWAIFKHGQTRRQSVLGLGRAFCAGREVTNIPPGATAWYRAVRAKPERVWKSPSISAVGARQGAVRSLMKFEPVPRKKLEVLLKSSVCDPFRETRGNWRRPSGLSVALDVSRAEEQLTTARDISFRNEVVELDQFLFPALQLW